MPIQQNIPRKQGRIFTNPSAKSKKTVIFGPGGNAGSNVADATASVLQPTKTLLTRNFNVVSNTGTIAQNPIGTNLSTATEKYVPQLAAYGTSQQTGQGALPEVGPQEHGNFFSAKPNKDGALTRRSGGVDPNSDTPFHPKTTVVIRPRRYPTPAGERTKAQSFASTHYLTGNANQDLTAQRIHGTMVAAGRWATVKRSASDSKAPVWAPALVNARSRGTKVGSGLTGKVSTGNFFNKGASVSSNAHAGSPDVVPWVPNKRGVQPNEKGNTNPVKQNCVSLFGTRGCA